MAYSVCKIADYILGESKDCLRLHDYAAREYGDMLRYFYKPRWEKFINNARTALREGKETAMYDRYKYDKAFLEKDKKYSIKVQGNLFEVAKIIVSR